MCLYTPNERPIVATNDITCYKLLRMVGEGRYFTPFFDIPVSLGKAIEAEHPNHLPLKGLGNYLVTSEGVHAYTAKEDAIKVVSHSSLYFGYRVIAEATIPAGTEYWCDRNECEIAARRMIINRIIYPL